MVSCREVLYPPKSGKYLVIATFTLRASSTCSVNSFLRAMRKNLSSMATWTFTKTALEAMPCTSYLFITSLTTCKARSRHICEWSFSGMRKPPVIKCLLQKFCKSTLALQCLPWVLAESSYTLFLSSW